MSFNAPSRRRYRRQKWSLDELAALLMGLLVVAAIALILLGDHATVRVQRFSWQEHTVGADDTAFTITFTRPMDPSSVEANLQITPLLPGRVSWAGRRMAYTLDVPVPYGETFQVELPTARDRFAENNEAAPFESFTGTFQSRDRAIAYIGTVGEERDRLVLVNFSEGGEPAILTPPEWSVVDFEPYPLGDRILVSAVTTAAATTGEFLPDLYAVATGLAPDPPPDLTNQGSAIANEPDERGQVTPVLDSSTYQNLAFDLAPDGHTMVVQRVNRTDPGDFGPWLVTDGESPRPLATEPGGEFLIGPDSQTLLMLQGQGTAIIPLETSREGAQTVAAPLDFLPEFGRVFDVSSDGAAAAMVNFNQNNPELRFTETLFVVTNQGEETKVLDATGTIIAAEFDPTNRILYVLASDLIPGDDYQEQPYLSAVSLAPTASGELDEPIRLLTFPPLARVSMSLSPDGIAALIGITLPAATDPTRADTQTLLLPLFETTDQRINGLPTATTPQVLPFSGVMPTWLP